MSRAGTVRELVALAKHLAMAAVTVFGSYMSITAHWEATARTEVRAAMHDVVTEIRTYTDSLHAVQSRHITDLADLTLFRDP